MMRALGDHLYLDTDALDKLPAAERIELLTHIAQSARQRVADFRAVIIDELRIELGSDAAVAAALGVERQALTGVGDGPVVKIAEYVFARPQLLRRGVEIMLANWPSSQPAPTALRQAMEVLSRRGRPNAQHLRGAAVRIAGMSPPVVENFADSRTLHRALAHAAEVAGAR